MTNNTPEKDWRENKELNHNIRWELVDIATEGLRGNFDAGAARERMLKIFEPTISHVESTAFAKGQREAIERLMKMRRDMPDEDIFDTQVFYDFATEQGIDLSTNN